MTDTEQTADLTDWEKALLEAGMAGAKLLLQEYEPEHFGDRRACVSFGQLILRLVRERGEDFVDVGARHTPNAFFRYDDVCIALGWRTVEDVMERAVPMPLTQELSEIATQRRAALEAAFSPSVFTGTVAALRAAVRLREAAFLAKLESLAGAKD